MSRGYWQGLWRWRAPAVAAADSDGRTKALIAAVILVGTIALVFWQQIFGVAVFIGESDRLNSYLNMRLAEYDALKEFGHVPAWNPNMFGGFSMAALHWMNPGTDPIAYLLQLLPRGDIFQALGFISIALVLAACVTAYLYIREVTDAPVPSLVGGLAYGLSVFSLHRAAQVDNAEMTVVLIPLGLLALRRAHLGNLVRPMIHVTLVMTALAFWGFLQEVAYAFLFFGCYALYRAALLGRQTPAAAWAPVVVVTAGSLLALTFAAPRLITIQQEFLGLARTTTLHYYDYSQILRFFHEGIYGRYFEEGRLLGHGMNLHEGLQLVSSTALALFVCFGIARPRNWIETLGAVAFFALFAAMLPASDLLYGLVRRFAPDPLPFPLTLNLYKVGSYGFILVMGVLAFIRSKPYLRIEDGLKRLTPVAPRPADTSFHLFALTVVLFAILIYEGTYLVWRLFFRADFTHTRLSILALLPLCTLFAVYLAELKNLPIYGGVQDSFGRRQLIVLVILAGGVSYLINGPLLDLLIARDAIKLYLLDHNELMPTVALRIVLTAILFGAFMYMLICNKPRMVGLQSAASLIIGTFIVVEIVTYAHLKVGGPQTWTYPVAFRMFNYFNVPPSVMRPPEPSKLATFRKSFDVDASRVVVLSNDLAFPGTKIPHVAAFWGMRTIGGYGTGVSARMASLPWPKDVQTLRTIDFTSLSNLDTSLFPLLAFLNVKYLIVLTPDVYFNVVSRGNSQRDVSIGGRNYPLKTANIGGVLFPYMENPIKPLPRYFMVEKVVGSNFPPVAVRSLPPEGASASGIRIFEGQVDDLTHISFVERRFVDTTRKFDASGDLSVAYRGDVIEIRVIPSARERFVVLTDSYHPQWRVYAGNERTETVPTNLVMTGVLIPPGLDHVELRFEPFSSQRRSRIFMLAAMLGFVLFVFVLRRAETSKIQAS